MSYRQLLRDRAMARSDPFDRVPEPEAEPMPRRSSLLAKPVVFVLGSAVAGWALIAGVLWVALKVI